MPASRPSQARGPGPTRRDAPAPEPQRAADDEPGRRPRVLVAARPDVAADVRRLLEDRYLVETAPDGRAALDAARHLRPDLVLAEVALPTLGGVGLLRIFRTDALLQDVPLFLVIAHNTEEARVEAFEAGADDVLPTPFSPSELRARVASTLQTSRFRRDLARRERVARVMAETAAARTGRLQAITESFASVASPQEIATIVIREGAPALGAFSGSLGLLSPDGSHLRYVEISGYAPEAAETYRTVSMDAALPGPHVVRTGTPVWVEDLEALPARFPEAPTLSARSGARAAMVLPLCTDGPVIGTLIFGFRTPEEFSGERKAFAETLARITAQALDRARLFEAAREGLQRFQLLADALPQIVWEHDAQGEAVFINRRFFTYTGLPRTATLAERQTIYHPEDQARAANVRAEALRHRDGFELELRLRRHDGVYRCHLMRGVYAAETQRWYITATDIEDIKQVGNALRMSETLAHLALDLATIGTWTWDLVTGHGTLDAQSGEIFGLKVPEDFRPDVSFDVAALQASLILPEDMPGVLAAVKAGLASGADFGLDYRIRRPDGQVRHIVSMARALDEESGPAKRLLGTNRDVTEEHAA